MPVKKEQIHEKKQGNKTDIEKRISRIERDVSEIKKKFDTFMEQTDVDRILNLMHIVFFVGQGAKTDEEIKEKMEKLLTLSRESLNKIKESR